MLHDLEPRVRAYTTELLRVSPQLIDETISETLERLQADPPENFSVVYETCNRAGLAVVARYR